MIVINKEDLIHRRDQIWNKGGIQVEDRTRNNIGDGVMTQAIIQVLSEVSPRVGLQLWAQAQDHIYDNIHDNYKS